MDCRPHAWSFWWFLEGGTPGRNRTCDLSLRRRLLYPLSYWGMKIGTPLRVSVTQATRFNDRASQPATIIPVAMVSTGWISPRLDLSLNSSTSRSPRCRVGRLARGERGPALRTIYCSPFSPVRNRHGLEGLWEQLWRLYCGVPKGVSGCARNAKG